MEENNILTNLPVDVLELIMKRLHLKDYLGLRETCRSCRRTISNFIENKCCCHLPELPLVFLKSKKSRFVFSLSTKSLHCLRTPQLGRNNRCLGSIEGWLIVGDFSEKGFAKIFFSNPVTDVRMTIPSKLHLPSSAQCDGILPVRKMVASSKPNCDGSDCYLVSLFSDYCHIAIYKLIEKSWTIVEPDKDLRTYFTDLEIVGSKLYVTDLSSHSILVYDLKDSINGPPKAKVLVELPEIRPQESNYCSRFLAKYEALRELYIIYMHTNGECETQDVVSVRLKIARSFVRPPQISIFEVFRLDMDKDPIGWQNVKLEDRVFFVSRYKSMVMSRDEQNCNKELIGGSIYFADTFPCPKNPWSGLEFGIFCLTDSSIKYFHAETSKHGVVPLPLWFVPSLQMF